MPPRARTAVAAVAEPDQHQPDDLDAPVCDIPQGDPESSSDDALPQLLP